MNKISDGELFAYQCDAFLKTGLVSHGFSTRAGGVSEGAFSSLNLGLFTEDDREHVTENYRRDLSLLSIDPKHFVTVRQVHGNRVYLATEKDAGNAFSNGTIIPEADALITNVPELALGTFYADCTPILLLDPVRKAIASIHSGWRGTVAKIAGETVKAMQNAFGTNPADILACIGPSIKQCHFEVEEDAFQLFEDAFSDILLDYSIQIGKKFYIDTDALIIHTLTGAGVLAENITKSNLCTFCKDETFFSHRKSGGKTGRMCAVIELK